MPQEDQVPRRVGERLRQAREQQGIAIADAAERLHILASYIKALESGRYGVLPGTVFLRGYVRSYARILQLDADEIVAQLDRELGTADESQTGLKPVPGKSGKRRVGQWLGIAALIALVAGGGWYAQQQQLFTPNDTAPATLEPAPTLDEPEVANPEAAFDYEPDGAEPVDRPAAYDDEQASSEESPLVDPSEPSLEQGDSSSGVVDGAEDVEPAPQTEVGNADETAPESNGASPQPEVSEVVPEEGEQTIPVDRLEVSFSGDSWFELTDAEGNRRVGLFRAGDTLDHQGPAPFRVVVGAVSETSMRFNGVAVDFSNYRVRNNRAGLTLGQ